MAQIDQVQTIGAVSTAVVTVDVPDGTLVHEFHFSGDDAASGDCVGGDCHLVVKKQAGMAPVIKSFDTDLWHCDFVTPLALTASVVGNSVVVSVPGVAARTIDWTVTSGI